MKMKEILGEGLEKAFKAIGIKAVKNYSNTDKGYEVWELSNEEFEKICNIKDEDWQSDWGWWRSSEGSNMGSVNADIKINGKLLSGWINDPSEDDDIREYDNLLNYFCWELGCSQPRNVTALAVDLASQNEITMSELFRKYQG